MSILNRFQLRAWVLGCLVCGLWQSGATAAVITYTDQNVFNAAVTGQVAQDFSGFSGFYLNGLVVSVPGYTISASAPGELYALFGTMSTNNADALLTFTFTGTLPTAVGGLFFVTDINFNALSSTLKVSLGDGTFINLPAPTGGGLNTTGAFAGFTSDVGITSLTVGAPFSSAQGTGYATVNSLYVGTGGPTAAVPEPSSIALLGFGAVGLFAKARRRRRQAKLSV